MDSLSLEKSALLDRLVVANTNVVRALARYRLNKEYGNWEKAHAALVFADREVGFIARATGFHKDCVKR